MITIEIPEFWLRVICCIWIVSRSAGIVQSAVQSKREKELAALRERDRELGRKLEQAKHNWRMKL